MADVTTRKTQASPKKFIEAIADEGKRKDSLALMKMMQRITGEAPKMWGGSIVGFGDYHYKYESGREGDWFLTGFSPRKQALSLYIMSGFEGHAALLAELGKFKTGKSCLYVKRLDDVDLKVLETLIRKSVASKRQGG